MKASENERARFDAEVCRLVRNLRDLAENVARIDRSEPYQATTDITHALAWGFANLNADGLCRSVMYLHQYEEAERKEKEKTDGD